MFLERKQEEKEKEKEKVNSPNQKEKEEIVAVNSNFEHAIKQKSLYIRMENKEQNYKERTPSLEKFKANANPLSLLYKRFDFGNSPSLSQALKHKRYLSKQQQASQEASLERIAWTPQASAKSEKKKINLVPSYAGKVNYHLHEEFQKKLVKKPSKKSLINDYQVNTSLQEGQYEPYERQNVRSTKPKAFSIHRNQASFSKENSIIAFIAPEKKGMEKSHTSQIFSQYPQCETPVNANCSTRVDRGTSTDHELERVIKENSEYSTSTIKTVYKEPFMNRVKSPKSSFEFKKLRRQNIKTQAVPGATQQNSLLKALTPQSKTGMFFLNENNSSFLKSEFF